MAEGDLHPDGSFVLYEHSGHFATHSDAACPMRYPRRTWTFLVYLHAPKNGSGNTEFTTAGRIIKAAKVKTSV